MNAKLKVLKYEEPEFEGRKSMRATGIELNGKGEQIGIIVAYLKSPVKAGDIIEVTGRAGVVKAPAIFAD